MDFDIKLANNLPLNEAVFRVYRWSPYCISLGANQNLNEINSEKAQSDNIDVVKRPTGGRAILHSEEITYSVVYPINLSTSARDIYNQINLALKKGLIYYNSKLKNVELEHNQPDFKDFYKQDKSSICFAVSAKSEINYNNRKLIGSAQRKLGQVILQHGSILCGKYHLNIVDYLELDMVRKSRIRTEISESTIDLGEILLENVNYERLIESLKSGFEDHFEIDFVDFKELTIAV